MIFPIAILIRKFPLTIKADTDFFSSLKTFVLMKTSRLNGWKTYNYQNKTNSTSSFSTNFIFYVQSFHISCFFSASIWRIKFYTNEVHGKLILGLLFKVSSYLKAWVVYCKPTYEIELKVVYFIQE